MALFQKGNPGRPKGAKNKFRVMTVKDYLEINKINPIEKVMELIGIVSMRNPEQAARIWLSIQQWVDPKTFKMENGEQRAGYPSAIPKGDEGVILDVLKPYEIASNG